jgi:hypothetical protein
MGSWLAKASGCRKLERFDPGVACARTFRREHWHGVAMNGLSVCPVYGPMDDGRRRRVGCSRRALPVRSADAHDLGLHLHIFIQSSSGVHRCCTGQKLCLDVRQVQSQTMGSASRKNFMRSPQGSWPDPENAPDAAIELEGLLGPEQVVTWEFELSAGAVHGNQLKMAARPNAKQSAFPF